MRGKLLSPWPDIPRDLSFNEARALCAGSYIRASAGDGLQRRFNEARALCAGSFAWPVDGAEQRLLLQ